jgi:hypothetical protein
MNNRCCARASLTWYIEFPYRFICVFGVFGWERVQISSYGADKGVQVCRIKMYTKDMIVARYFAFLFLPRCLGHSQDAE